MFDSFIDMKVAAACIKPPHLALRTELSMVSYMEEIYVLTYTTTYACIRKSNHCFLLNAFYGWAQCAESGNVYGTYKGAVDCESSYFA